MSSPAPATVSVRNVFRRFRRNRQGSAAVEFALIAPLFFGMLFAIIETAIVFFAGQVLEQGTAEIARLMLTHQAQDTGMTETDVQNRPLQSHQGDVQLPRQSGEHYCGCEGLCPGYLITITDPIVSGSLTGPFTYSLPPSGSPNTVVVRAFYQWPIYVTRFGYNISNLNGSKRLLAATAAFHVEP